MDHKILQIAAIPQTAHHRRITYEVILAGSPNIGRAALDHSRNLFAEHSRLKHSGEGLFSHARHELGAIVLAGCLPGHGSS